MLDPDYGWWSLLPPVSAIALAIVSRRVIPSLFAGLVAGCLVLGLLAPEPMSLGLRLLHSASALREITTDAFFDVDHLKVITFTLLMGAMVGVIYRSGGMSSVVDALAPLARNRRGAQLTTWALGLIVFIDDYANSLLLGNTMRPLTDRLRISREKLAYLVDSTAAPVSGLAVVSTWVAGEISYIKEGLNEVQLVGGSPDAFPLFVATIPTRFYVLWALLFVPLVALTGRDFGPMLRAEQAAWAHRPRPSAEASRSDRRPRSRSWLVAVVPIVVTVVVTVVWLMVTGLGETGMRLADLDSVSAWGEVFGNGSSTDALVYGSLLGFLLARWLGATVGQLPARRLEAASLAGAGHVLPACVILWLAWSLGQLTDSQHLMTADFLGGLLENAVAPYWMPTLVFVLAAVVAFSTGTSWGTMGILMPLVIQSTVRVLTNEGFVVSADNPILVASIGGVLAGAIFGDHCSPISDTTVLSSTASSCNHIEHVRTQMPYALLVAGVSILAGCLPVGFGAPLWLLHLLGPILLIASLYTLGRRP
jgi:Na+/H+ antiporter NhaC